jgi:hypothetical protein
MRNEGFFLPVSFSIAKELGEGRNSEDTMRNYRERDQALAEVSQNHSLGWRKGIGLS